MKEKNKFVKGVSTAGAALVVSPAAAARGVRALTTGIVKLAGNILALATGITLLPLTMPGAMLFKRDNKAAKVAGGVLLAPAAAVELAVGAVVFTAYVATDAVNFVGYAATLPFILAGRGILKAGNPELLKRIDLEDDIRNFKFEKPKINFQFHNDEKEM